MCNNFKKNIFFIEDCTHNIFNKDFNLKYFNNKKIFKFASIKKYLPFPVGAINNIEKIKLNKLENKEETLIKEVFEIFKKDILISQKRKSKNLKLERHFLKIQNKYKQIENKKIMNYEIPTIILKNYPL